MHTTRQEIRIYDLLFSGRIAIGDIFEDISNRTPKPADGWFEYSTKVLEHYRKNSNLQIIAWLCRAHSHEVREQQAQRLFEVLDSYLEDDKKISLLSWFFIEMYEVIPANVY